MNHKVLKFYADWCAPCKQLSTYFTSTLDSIGVSYEEINVEDNPDVATKYGVRGLPTVIKVDKETGEKVGTPKVGLIGEQQLKEWASNKDD